jgi:hypothetical protein
MFPIFTLSSPGDIENERANVAAQLRRARRNPSFVKGFTPHPNVAEPLNNPAG